VSRPASRVDFFTHLSPFLRSTNVCHNMGFFLSLFFPSLARVEFSLVFPFLGPYSTRIKIGCFISFFFFFSSIPANFDARTVGPVPFSPGQKKKPRVPFFFPPPKPLAANEKCDGRRRLFPQRIFFFSLFCRLNRQFSLRFLLPFFDAFPGFFFFSFLATTFSGTQKGSCCHSSYYFFWFNLC